MKKIYVFALVALVTIAFSSCNMIGGGGNNTPEYRLSDLQALWLEDKANVEHYVRFTTEKADEEGYFFGREWNLDEDVKEEDLYVYKKDEQGQDSLIHGNGWFQYLLETQGGLHEIHFMENGGADIPKEYIVSLLTDVRLEYYEKDNKNRKFFFNKVVETK